LALYSSSHKILRLPGLSKLRGVHEGLAAAAFILEDGEFWGFIDTLGNWLIPPEYLAVAEKFSDSRAWVFSSSSGGGLAAFVDTSGAWLPGTAHLWLSNYHNGFALFGEGRQRGKHFQGLYGLMNQAGEIVIPAQFTALGQVRQGWAPVVKGRESYLIDTLGQTHHRLSGKGMILEGPESGWVPLLGPQGWEFHSLASKDSVLGPFQDLSGFREGWARVQAREGCWGFIDSLGRILGTENSALR
jgi:hypothetical protein